MDGVGIFSFTMAEQPQLLRDLMRFSGCEATGNDYFVMHQANRYIIETVAKKSAIPLQKAPSATFSRYGNLNSASIPGVLCGELASVARQRDLDVVLQGFGVGLSWASAILSLEGAINIGIHEYTKQDKQMSQKSLQTHWQNKLSGKDTE